MTDSQSSHTEIRHHGQALSGSGLVSRRTFAALGVTAAGAWLTACSSSGGSGSGGASSGAAATETGPGTSASGPDPDETGMATADPNASASVPPGTVLLKVGTASRPDDFSYDLPTLTATADTKIKLKFSNNTDRKDEIGHNWVLVQPGQEAAVVASGKTAGDTVDWIKTDDPAIIAHTRLIEGGQSNTILFKAPPAGTYTYLCTFPDHFTHGQKGTLTIT
jgi:azurin